LPVKERPQPIKNILTAKHRAAWRPVSLLARSLFRLLDQSQALVIDMRLN
jgi:hypothetical protein